MSVGECVMKYISPKTYVEYINYREGYNRLLEYKDERKNDQKTIESIKHIINNNNIILGIEYKKEIKENIIIYRKREEPTIFVVSASNPTIMYTKIDASYREISINLELNTTIIIIYINDIVSYSYINKGFASIAMKFLLKVARDENIRRVNGWISKGSEEHLERIQHFYNKHGFYIDKYNYIEKEIPVLIR